MIIVPFHRAAIYYANNQNCYAKSIAVFPPRIQNSLFLLNTLLQVTLYFHIVAWLAYVTLYAALWSIPDRSFPERFLYEASLLPFKLTLTYTVILWLVPSFLFNKRHVTFAFLLICVIICTGILHQLHTYYLVNHAFNIQLTENLWDWSRISRRVTYLTTPMIFAGAAVIFQFYYRQNESVKALNNAKLSAELKLLKAQLNPHFFFNTLNNLYSLAMKKSDQTPRMILRLADLMRYTLDNNERDEVRLEEEIAFIRNYVEIEQERFGAKAPVAWNVNVNNQSLLIPPLTLITFVENAFKHGVSPSRQPAPVEISLSEEEDSLIYTVSNPNPKVASKVEGKSQIGLSNLKQRMELIYGQHFSMTIRSSDMFSASMKIPKSR